MILPIVILLSACTAASLAGFIPFEEYGPPESLKGNLQFLPTHSLDQPGQEQNPGHVVPELKPGELLLQGQPFVGNKPVPEIQPGSPFFEDTPNVPLIEELPGVPFSEEKPNLIHPGNQGPVFQPEVKAPEEENIPNLDLGNNQPSSSVNLGPGLEGQPGIPEQELFPNVELPQVEELFPESFKPESPSQKLQQEEYIHKGKPNLIPHGELGHDVPQQNVKKEVPSLEVGPENPLVVVRDKAGQYSFGLLNPGPNGQKISEQGRLFTTNEGWEYVIVKKGFYSYTSPEGIPVSVEWEADHNGFRIIDSTV